jgi:hypothetical protein
MEENLAIVLVLKDRLAPVSACHDVIDRPGILETKRSGHARTLFSLTAPVNHFVRLRGLTPKTDPKETPKKKPLDSI